MYLRDINTHILKKNTSVAKGLNLHVDEIVPGWMLGILDWSAKRYCSVTGKYTASYK
jgi:hypothetical protein